MLESIETTVDHTFGELLAGRIDTYIYPDAPKKKLTIVLRMELVEIIVDLAFD